VPIDVEFLKSEREKQKASLREVEVEQRKVEGELKALRQKEIRAKREIDALSTLIELQEVRAEAADGAPGQAP
jgi:septation ring formation regulator EzrA